MGFQLFGNAEAIEDAVVRGDVGSPIRDRQPTEVIPRLDLCAAGPELFACEPVERVERGLAGIGNAPRGAGAEAAAVARTAGLVPGCVLHDLRSVFAGSVGEYDAVCDHHFIREIHVAREPGGYELPLAAALLELEGRDAAARRARMLDRRLE